MVAFNKCLWLARRNRKPNKFLKEKQLRIIINDDKLIGASKEELCENSPGYENIIQYNACVRLLQHTEFDYGQKKI